MTTSEGMMQDQLKELSPEELYQLYMEKQVNFGRAVLALDQRRQQNRLHVSAEEANVANAGPDQRMIVGPELGFNIHNLHVFTSGRAGGSERYHTHGDALKFYVQGSGYELIGEERFAVKVGDFCHVPANIWHGTENPNPEPLVFLAAQQFPGTYRQVSTPFIHLVPPANPPEVKDLSEGELGKLPPWQLYLRYLAEQMEFGRVALEMQRRRQQKRLHLPAEEAPLMEWGPGRHHIMSPELGFDIYSFQLFMEHVPGGTEQDQGQISGDAIRYYLSGRGVEMIGDQRIEVTAGDFTCIPAGTRHDTSNPYPEPLRFLCWQQIPGTYLQVHTPYLPLQ
ncbi:MAG: cupin domain-containing protein [Dehalococcoidia bacterium]